MEEASKHEPFLKTLGEVVVYAHKLFKAPIDREKCAMQVSKLYVDFMVGMMAVNESGKQGPGIRLDFASFLKTKI